MSPTWTCLGSNVAHKGRRYSACVRCSYFRVAAGAGRSSPYTPFHARSPLTRDTTESDSFHSPWPTCQRLRSRCVQRRCIEGPGSSGCWCRGTMMMGTASGGLWGRRRGAEEASCSANPAFLSVGYRYRSASGLFRAKRSDSKPSLRRSVSHPGPRSRMLSHRTLSADRSLSRNSSTDFE